MTFQRTALSPSSWWLNWIEEMLNWCEGKYVPVIQGVPGGM
jgi:hypothetical protein